MGLSTWPDYRYQPQDLVSIPLWDHRLALVTALLTLIVPLVLVSFPLWDHRHQGYRSYCLWRENGFNSLMGSSTRARRNRDGRYGPVSIPLWDHRQYFLGVNSREYSGRHDKERRLGKDTGRRRLRHRRNNSHSPVQTRSKKAGIPRLMFQFPYGIIDVKWKNGYHRLVGVSIPLWDHRLRWWLAVSSSSCVSIPLWDHRSLM